MDTEACGDGTSHLGLFLGVSIFIGCFCVGIMRRGASGAPHSIRVHPRGGTLVLCGHLGHLLVLPRSFLGLFPYIKNRQKVSLHLENFYFCTKNNTTVVLLKTASVRVSSKQIIPKPYRIVINMAWILHKL
jgi:hypothetical protein